MRRWNLNVVLTFFGCFPTTDLQTPPTLLRGDLLGIKDTQCANKNDGREISYHIKSRLGATGAPKMQLSSKVGKFAG